MNGGAENRANRSYMSVDCRYCSPGSNAIFFNLWFEAFFQKGQTALLAKSYNGDGEPCAWKCLPHMSGPHN